MGSFSLELNSSAQCQQIDGVSRFIGEDASGSFGILPGRAPLITQLNYGLAQFTQANGTRQYLACPGALISFRNNHLVLSTRRYLISGDYREISAELIGQLADEKHNLASVKCQFKQLEQELMQRMHQLHRGTR